MIRFREKVLLTVAVVDSAGNTIDETEQCFPAGSVVDARIVNPTKLYVDLRMKDGRIIRSVLRETFKRG